MKRVPVIETDLGLERLCSACGEFWPMDEEFWYFQTSNGKARANGRCKACWAERRLNEGRLPPLVVA